MKKNLFTLFVGYLLMFIAFPANAQTLHRYVVEVETAPLTQRYKTEKLINGEVKAKHQDKRKTVHLFSKARLS